MLKVLILPLYGIGDVLMTTPAVRNLKEQIDAKITYLHMFKTTRDILLDNPFIDENIYFPFLESGRLANVNFMLRFRKKFDVSINFYPSNRRDYNLASFIVGSPMRIGHRYMRRDLRELNFLKNKIVKENDGRHNVEEDLRLLDFLGIEGKRYPMEIYLTEEETRFAKHWLAERKIDRRVLLGVHPGTSTFKNHAARRWSERSFAALIDVLAAEVPDSIFLVFGGPEEVRLRETIISQVREKERVISVDFVTVRQAAALMKKCSLFISNDSGPMHIAAASGVPAVAIFGPTNPVWVRPWGVRHKVVRIVMPCSPCFRYSPKPLHCTAETDYACLKGISVEQVFGPCVELLRDTADLRPLSTT